MVAGAGVGVLVGAVVAGIVVDDVVDVGWVDVGWVDVGWVDVGCVDVGPARSFTAPPEQAIRTASTGTPMVRTKRRAL